MTLLRVPVGDVSLALEERGAGPPLVVLHGFTGSGRAMTGVARALAADFRTLAVDLIGHGHSDRPRELAPYRMAAAVDQLRGLLEQRGVERARWLGYSMGGRVALAFAVAHPERVERLLLVGASAGIADPTAREERVRADEQLAERIERVGVEAFVDDWMALPLFASQSRLGPAALAEARSQRLDNDSHALAHSLRGMGSGAQEPLHERLPQLWSPVCLAVGDEDTKFDAIARELADRLPNATVERIPNAGHAAHLENPDGFGAAARRFFTQEGAA